MEQSNMINIFGICSEVDLSLFEIKDPLNKLRMKLTYAIEYYDIFKDMEDSVPAWLPIPNKKNNEYEYEYEKEIEIYDNIVDDIYEELIAASKSIIEIMKEIKGTAIENERLGQQGADTLSRIYLVGKGHADSHFALPFKTLL
jgi:hypothetical protein